MDEFERAAGQVAAGGFDQAASEVVSAERNQFRPSLYNALTANPDAAAKANRLSRRTGVPADIIDRNLAEVQRNASLDDYDKAVLNSPNLARWLSDQRNASASHDDVGTLSAIEKGIRQFLDPSASDRKRTRAQLGEVASFLGEGVKQIGMGATVGLGAGIQDMAGFGLDLAAGATGSELLGNASAVYRGYATRARESMDYFSRKYEGNIAQGAMSGFRSAGTSLSMLPMGIAGGSEAMVGVMASMVGAESFSKARNKGQSRMDAAIYALPDAAFEYAFEKVPASRLLEDIAKRSTVFTTIRNQLLPEIFGEQATTLLQGFNEWARINPEKTTAQFVAEQQDAAVQTFVASLVGIGVQAGAVRGVQSALGAGEKKDQEAQSAERAANVAQTLSDLSAASKLRERDPEAFKQFVEGVAGDGEVYIDAEVLTNTLNQSAITIEELRAVAPKVAAQIEAAQQVPGAGIAIPVSEWMAAGQELTAPLLDHIREAPDSMSRLEAQEFLKTEGESIRADVEREVARQVQQSEAEQSVAMVRDSFEKQLNTAGRFRPEVNRAYATMLGHFYVNQAERAGVPVEEFMQRYGLRVAATAQEGQQVVEQGAPETPAFRKWFGDSKVVDANGKPLVVYHATDADSIVSFDRTKLGSVTTWNTDAKQARNMAQLGFWFADSDVSDNTGQSVTYPVHVSMRAPRVYRTFDTMWAAAQRFRSGDKWRASLESQGHDGVILRDDTEFSVTSFVAFRPEQIKSAIGNRGTFDPADPNILNQGARAQLSFSDDITTAPSVIALLEGADLSSFIHESGHFFLEVEFDLTKRILAKPEGERTASEQQIVADMDVLLKWFGIEGAKTTTAIDEWSQMSLEERRDHHEKFARGFERYAMEGKAPNQDLQSIFSRFRSWLVQVYKSLKALAVPLNDDVRAVMDRMLASNQAIQQAQDARNMGPLFQSPEQSGMTPEEFAAYQDLGAKATGDAAAALDERLMKDMKWLSKARARALKEAQATADELRAEAQREVRAEVLSQPVYQAWQFLTGRAPKPMVESEAMSEWRKEAEDWKQKRLEAEGAYAKEERSRIAEANPDVKGLQKGQLLAKNRRQIDLNVAGRMLTWEQQNRPPVRPQEAGDVAFEGFEVGKLDRDAVKAIDKAVASTLQERKMTRKEGGVDPDALAEQFGFSSGDEMVRALAAAPPPQQVIDEQTDQRMLERYGDIASPEALARAADEAIYSEARQRMVAAELKALTKAGSVRARQRGTVNALAQAAKSYAEQIVARLRVRDIKPSVYGAAQARSAKLAQQSLGKSTEEAALHKRNELINSYAKKAADEALQEVEAMRRYFRKFDKRSKTIDQGYQDQIEQLLERYEFRPVSLKALDKRKAFRVWYDEQVAQGLEPDVPDRLLYDSGLQSYKDMTVDELRGLFDTVKQIEHLGRVKNKLLLAREKRDFDAVRDEMAASIVQYGGKARPVELEGPSPVVDWLASKAAQHRKLSSLFHQMDGNKDSGPLWEFIGRPMNERGAMEDTMIERATVALSDLYSPLLELRGGLAGSKSKVWIPEVGASLTRGGRLAVALNWGNEDNRARIRDGDNWTDAQVAAILRTLTPAELEFVNKAWEYLDSYWPEIAAKEKRVTGVEPKKVEAAPFVAVASDGTQVKMRGGYYPIKYDAERSDRAAKLDAAQVASEMKRGAFVRSTTRRGHTKQRAEGVERAIRKDLNVMTQHINQVIHDLSWHEWLIDANKLIDDSKVADAIRTHYGPRVLQTMRNNITAIAAGDVSPMDATDKALMWLRSNVSRATMGASVTTAFLQPFGLTQSMARIGSKHVLSGVKRWAGDAVQMENTVAWITERSEFMRLRKKTFNRELREISQRLKGRSKTMQAIDGGLFFLMQKMQMVADVPTWLGQYEKSLAEGADEATAIAQADRAVMESQGGGSTKDLAEVQRKHPLLTQFYSYFSTTLNLVAEKTAQTDFKNPAAVAGWLGDMALLIVIPAILPALVMHLLRGGSDDDDEPAVWARRIAQWQAGYLLGMVVGARELTGIVGGFEYNGVPAGRIVSDIGNAAIQIRQGEADEAAVKAIVNVLGTTFGLPVVQILRSYRGWKARDEGEDRAGPQSVLLGPPPRE